jgi:predicted enzyme related to lactoylglutathione lyase
LADPGRQWSASSDAVSRERERSPVNLNSILIGSENSERLAEYYTKLFGEPGWNDGGYVGWLIGGGGLTVGPHDQVKGRNTQPGRIIWNIESQDVQAEFARLKEAGAIVVREPYNFEQVPGTWIATFSDPDDNYFQLVSPVVMPT